jgi:ribonuclease HI
LLLYLAASPTTVSAVLVEEKEHQNKMKQFPVYFASEALSGAKLNYSELEKIAYTVVMASRKLKHYFRAHRIKVLSAQSLKALFRNSEAIGRINKWATELNEFVVAFQHRSAIKSQALIDFIADWTPAAFDTTIQFEEPTWIVHCDGAWGMAGIGIAAILTSPKGPKLRYAAMLEFPTTNNIAEYEVVLLGLRKLRALGVRRCIVRSDSQVIMGHIEKEFTTKEPELIKYLAAVRRMEKHITGFTFRHIPRSENNEADELAKAAVQKAPMPADIFYQELLVKSI